jgi:tetratricopeptide (TPR) repeat protein
VPAQAHRALAEIYRSQNNTKGAFDNQIKAAAFSAEDRMILAKWYYDEKRTGEARPYAQGAATAFQARLQNNVDDHAARQNLIQCRVWLGEYDEAKMQIQQGLVLAPNAEVRNNYLGNLLLTILIEYDTKTDAKTGQSRLTPAERYALLERGLQEFPNEFSLLQRLVALYRLEGDEGTKVRKVFADLMTSGQTTALANLILGLEYWQKDNPGEARLYWEKALEASKQTPNKYGQLIGNNLAYVLTRYPPDDEARAQADLERAMDLIDEVVKKADEPQFHSTRGLILVKMGRHKEALPELEKGVKFYKDDVTNGPFILRQIAETCRQLKLDNSAVDYDRRADELAARAKANTFVGPPKPEGLSAKPEQVPPVATSTPDVKQTGDSGR